MKIFILILMGLTLVGCQREQELTPEEITPLVGKWRQIAYERTTETGREWVDVTDTNVYNTLIFRADGIPLYANGKGMCCAPRSFIIGGRTFKIEPKSPVELDGICIQASCYYCESVELEVNQNEMVWNSCNGFRLRYRLEP